MEPFALTAALLAGALLALHAAANLQLNKAVGSPYGAATLQIGMSTVLLVVLAIATGGIGAASGLYSVDLWKLLGGIAGPIYITSAIVLFTRVGAMISVGLFVTGQMIASVVLDVGGLAGLERQPFTARTGLGAAAVLVGITVVVRSQLRRSKRGMLDRQAGGFTLRQAGWIPLGLVAGAVLPVQGAVNAALRAEIDHPFTVGAVSFIVATMTISLVLLTVLGLRRAPRPRLRPLARMPWWGWLGAVVAAAYVTATFLLIPEIGAATTIVLTITGQQVASAVVDHRGLFQMPVRPLTTPRITGLMFLVIGSAAVQLG